MSGVSEELIIPAKLVLTSEGIEETKTGLDQVAEKANDMQKQADQFRDQFAG